ncbi:MAG: HDOD domain-containing protein [Planctomycetes bacterium]|nr:HDOD domain-containing protein [Planctomycetota bacterium]
MSDVKALVNDISDLPTLPDVVAKLNRMITDPSTSAGDINDVISRDVSLSAKILKLVNSPYYGFARRITTITYAVVILGFNTVRNLALSAFIFDAFKNRSKSGFNLKDFWRHSIGTAIASSAVAKNVEGVSDEDAFMAGLLHGVGLVVMNQHLNEDLEKVISVVKQKDCLFLEAEHEVLGYDHCEVGGLLLEKWNLPEFIVDSVRFYSDPSKAVVAPKLAAAVHVGNLLVRSLSIGSAGDKKVPCLDEQAWQALGLDWDAADRLMMQIVGEIKNADEFFAMT